MHRSAPWWPERVALAFALALLLLVAPRMALAVGAAPAMTTPVALVEFKHQAWSIEQGAPSRINSIAQTRDGFLWIGSVEGLFRFDGMTFEAVRMPGAQAPRLVVSSLRVARSGELWVGLARGRGVARVDNGALLDMQMPNPSREVNDIQEDAQGGVWVVRGGRSDRTLARFHDGRWQEVGPEQGLPAQPAWALLFARDGTMWVVLSRTLAFRRPGDARFTDAGISVTPRASLSEDPAGQIWVSDADGTRPLREPRASERFIAHPGRIGGSRMLFDTRGDLWTTTWNSGVLRISAPAEPGATARAEPRRVGVFNAAAGLTSDQSRALFQDREGNVWVGTELGLDQLRPARLVAEPALPANSPTSYRLAVAGDGTVYVADADALYAIPAGQAPRRVAGHDSPAEALCAAGRGGVWLFLADRVLRVEGGPQGWTVQRQPKPPGSTAYGCIEDAAGRLWMPGLERGLHWREASAGGGGWQRWPEQEPSASLPANAAAGPDGRAAILFRGEPPSGELPFLGVGAAQSRAGSVEGLLLSDAGLLVSGHRGLAPAGDQSGHLLPVQQHPWAASLNGLAQTRGGQTWAVGDAGIVRMASADLAEALRTGADELPHQVFDFEDGLNSFAQKAPGAQVVVGGDGRVWFLTRRNVLRLDPAAISPNALKPPVLVRSVEAAGRRFAAEVGAQVPLLLPAGTTTVRINYTAPSLTVPRRVKFRHRLVGGDEAWSTPDGARSVLLSDLGPGRYRFEVMAANDDGLWSDEAASVTLEIPATFVQSLAFKVAAVVLGGLLLYGLYLLRVRQLLARIRERAEERSRERERIARDMHDTLLQSVQGLILRFQAAADRLQGDAQTQQVLNQALDRAEAVLVDGRERLQGLRRVEASDFQDEVRRLLAEQPFAQGTQLSVSTKGHRRRLRPSVFDELLCIVNEALFNAARHAQARVVEVQIDYGGRWLFVSVRDDGVGIDDEAAERAGRAGHFGMLGMRERAERIGAQFRILGQAGQGTLLTLRLRAGIAYAREAA